MKKKDGPKKTAVSDMRQSLRERGKRGLIAFNPALDPIMKELVKEQIMAQDKDTYVIITWPDIQEYMDKEGFAVNASLANDEWTLDEYGSSAYFVRIAWLKQLDKK